MNFDYSDDDLTFFLLSYRDYERTETCLQRLRAHLPRARVVVRSDGDDDPRYLSLVRRFGVDYRPEPMLFPVENGAAVVARMFEIFLEKPTPHLFKIDPDTVVHRRFRYRPICV